MMKYNSLILVIFSFSLVSMMFHKDNNSVIDDWNIGDNWKIKVSLFGTWDKRGFAYNSNQPTSKLLQEYELDITVSDTISDKNDSYYVLTLEPDTILPEMAEIPYLSNGALFTKDSYYVIVELFISRSTGETKSAKVYYVENEEKILYVETKPQDSVRFPFFCSVGTRIPYFRILPILWKPSAIEDAQYYTNTLKEVNDIDSSFCMLKNKKNQDTIINELNLRPYVLQKEYVNKYTFFWLDKHKWWVKYEYECTYNTDVTLRAELIEENLAR